MESVIPRRQPNHENLRAKCQPHVKTGRRQEGSGWLSVSEIAIEYLQSKCSAGNFQRILNKIDHHWTASGYRGSGGTYHVLDGRDAALARPSQPNYWQRSREGAEKDHGPRMILIVGCRQRLGKMVGLRGDRKRPSSNGHQRVAQASLALRHRPTCDIISTS